ncbi:DUF397 domain-containing protein [Saccharopolyspora gregorii]|uniref:DUF397 domain-containing protein n=1 Tax=Saccharopolyspora gregorii TaxID=33914 RepID=UPI0021AC43D3|nr:DUF397 domain-containing protein [Saccharopolyspora gregorii]
MSALGWRKSSRSVNTDNCVEVGRSAGGAAVRDTKDRAAGYFAVPRPRWSEFLAALKSGRLAAEAR